MGNILLMFGPMFRRDEPFFPTFYQKQKRVGKMKDFFNELNISESEVAQFHKAFRKMDWNVTGSVDAEKFASYLKVQNDPFIAELFFDSKPKGEICLAFLFVRLLYFVTTPSSVLAAHIFSLLETQGTLRLDHEFVKKFIRDLYGVSAASDVCATAASGKLTLLIAADTQKKGIDKIKFCEIFGHPRHDTLKPCTLLREAIRSRIGGIKYWERFSNKVKKVGLPYNQAMMKCHNAWAKVLAEEKELEEKKKSWKRTSSKVDDQQPPSGANDDSNTDSTLNHKLDLSALLVSQKAAPPPTIPHYVNYGADSSSGKYTAYTKDKEFNLDSPAALAMSSKNHPSGKASHHHHSAVALAPSEGALLQFSATNSGGTGTLKSAPNRRRSISDSKLFEKTVKFADTLDSSSSPADAYRSGKGFNTSRRAEPMGLVSVKSKPRAFDEAPPAMLLNSSSKIPKKELDKIGKEYRVAGNGSQFSTKAHPDRGPHGGKFVNIKG